MPEVLEVWATSQKGHITSPLVVESLLQYQWPLSTIYQRTLAKACGKLDGHRVEMQKRGSGLKTIEENIALPREVFSGEG